MSEKRTDVAIVGAGLVGTLCAIVLAQKGYNVSLFDLRADPRNEGPAERARSINLALSARGIASLAAVDSQLAQSILEHALPMRGRMLHTLDSRGNLRLEGQDYGNFGAGECINSISRSELSKLLVEYLVANYEVDVAFQCKLERVEWRERVKLVLVDTAARQERSEEVDWLIGADGAFSRVRREMMRAPGMRLDYAQTYAPHSYLELAIPSGPDDTFSISPYHLHIWPRGEFMLIALPNLDKSFTVTLFAHDATFLSLNEDQMVQLFSENFPDALELITEAEVRRCWRENPKDGLVTVETSPYHYRDKGLLIGDAAHAMVPFYGQGMNCGFEDVRVLSCILDQFLGSDRKDVLPYSPVICSRSLDSLGDVLAAYSEIRRPSLQAIQKLAADNYKEMAHDVMSPWYRIRRQFDLLLSRVIESVSSAVHASSERLSTGYSGAVAVRTDANDYRGAFWEPLYAMVTFRHGIAYDEVIMRRTWQGQVLKRVGDVVLSTVTLGAIALAFRSRTVKEKLIEVLIANY